MKKNPIKSGLRETMAGKVTFLFLLFLYTGVMLYLFWMECYQVPGFQSDMPDYVNKVAGIAEKLDPGLQTRPILALDSAGKNRYNITPVYKNSRKRNVTFPAIVSRRPLFMGFFFIEPILSS